MIVILKISSSVQTNEFKLVKKWVTLNYKLSTLAKEFMAATCIMQSSSNEMSTLVSGKTKMWTNEGCYLIA